MKKSKDYLKVYKSIEDCPIWNYEKCQVTGNVKYICAIEDYSNVQEEQYMHEAFDKVFTEFYDYFGISNELKEFLNSKRAITILEVDYQLTKDSLKLTQLNKKKEEFNNNYRVNDTDIDKIAVQLSRWLKFDVDTKKTTVKRFYNYLNALIKENNGKD